MRYKVGIMDLRRGNQTLAIARQFVEGAVYYVGHIHGCACVRSLTKERAVCGLLRRLACGLTNDACRVKG